MIHNMSRDAMVPRGEWLKFFDQFASGNQGRPVRVETFGGELGDEEVGRRLPLLSINYDPNGKGGVVTIATGRREVEYEHSVAGPKEVWVERDASGAGQAIEIVSEGGTRTVLSFEQ